MSFPSSQDFALMILKQKTELEDWKFLFLKHWCSRKMFTWTPKEKRPLGIIRPYSPKSSVGKEPTCNAGDLGSIPGLRRSPGEGKGYPLQYSGLENSMDCMVHRVTKSWTQQSDFHFTSNGMIKSYSKKGWETLLNHIPSFHSWGNWVPQWGSDLPQSHTVYVGQIWKLNQCFLIHQDTFL